MSKKIKLGQPLEINVSKRFYDFNRQFAVKDIFDALVELITNSDDSYGRLYKKQKRKKDGGRILVEIDCRRGNKSLLVVRDRAEGMTLEEMVRKFTEVGTRTSEVGDRGFMARGAKDCTSLGDLEVNSIVNDKFYKCRLDGNLFQLTPLTNGTHVDEKLRTELKIDKGNGTVVVLHIGSQHKIPRIETIAKDLPWHYALKDILSETSDSEVFIRKYGTNQKPMKIVYRHPEGKILLKQKYPIPSYPGVEAYIEIWKSNIFLEDPVDKQRFRKSGFIIKSKRAIHECSLLQPSFEKDENANCFFGRIDCPFIDKLLDDYDKYRSDGSDHPVDNPSLIIDPNRQYGLVRKHPFTKELIETPTNWLQDLIEKEKGEKRTKENRIANEETRKKLNELARAASKFLMQQIEELELSTDEGVDEDSFTKRGVLIYPTYSNISLDNIRTFYFYVNKKFYDKENTEIALLSDSDAIEFIEKKFILKKHPKKLELLYGKFHVKGVKLQKGIHVETNCVGIPKAEALFNVVSNIVGDREFNNPLEFEHKKYTIKEGTRKTIKLFAKFPDVVNAETEIRVTTSNTQDLPIRGRCILVPVSGSNYACADITIESRRIVSRAIDVVAKVDGIFAETGIKVMQKEDFGQKIDFDFADEDFGSFRATWADQEGKPNLLKIAARHPSVSRYLGKAPKYEGQSTVEFKIVLAEIIAESVCRKLLEMEAKQKSWLFNWADQKDDEAIADSVLYHFNTRMRTFLPIAHSIMTKT